MFMTYAEKTIPFKIQKKNNFSLSKLLDEFKVDHGMTH